MNPRRFLNFLRSPTGLVIIFLLILGIGLTIVISHRKRTESANESSKSLRPKLNKSASQTVETFSQPYSPFKVPSESPEKRSSAQPQKGAEPSTPTLPPLSVVAETISMEPEPKTLSEDFAPYGRLIPCELIVTVDSSSIRTPIVGLINEDIYHHGRLIIPAGTEVHGKAQVDRSRERIASEGQWTLVWQSGEELNLSGLALDREEEGNGWSITDGSAGLKGRLIKSDDLAEIKMFAATLISGAADALTDKRETPFGSYALPSLQNAPLRGGQKVLDRYAEQILRTIERDGFYVRVPAGKQFYLYVTQTIDKADAAFGSTSLATVQAAAAPTGGVPQFRPIDPSRSKTITAP